MFPEKLAYRDDLAAGLGLQKLRIIQPRPEVIANKDETGLRWSYDPDGCCEIRKVEPLARALRGVDAWISGRKGFHSSRSEEHTSELHSLMRISYAVFCLKKKQLSTK